MKLVGVLVFSASPFTAVAITNSSSGESLRRRMEEWKRLAVENAFKFRALAEQAREDISWYREEQPQWLGPIPYDYPSNLKGDYPGDYGFDIAGLAKDSITFEKYFKYAVSIIPAALGALVSEILDLMGAFQFVEPVWWKVGYSKLKVRWFSYQGDTLDYLGIPRLHFVGSQGVIIIAICRVLLMFGPEYARYCGIEALEPLGIYLQATSTIRGRGALFDPLNLSGNLVAFEELKVKEIKNGRLAMAAWLGFYEQAALTGEDPMKNLPDHVSDPFHNNTLSTLKAL